MAEKDQFDILNFLPYLLNQAAEASSIEFQRIYKARYGMLRTEWRVLFHLGLFGEMTARDICKRANMHKTKVSRAVQKLADRRFLTRTRDKADRRSEHLSLTPHGERVYRELLEIARAYDTELVAGFSAEDTDNVRIALRRLAGLD